jgi:hypothetical protein
MFNFDPVADPFTLITGKMQPLRLRGFGISPDGQRVCGTFVDKKSGQAFWWTRSSTAVPNQWAFDHGVGPSNAGASGKDINDSGDLVGFAAPSGPTGPSIPMLITSGSTSLLNFAAADANAKGNVINGIDNVMNIVGTLQLKEGNSLYPAYPQNKDIGFKTNASSPTALTNPELIHDVWSAIKPGALELRGFNSRNDLVGRITDGSTVEAFIVLNHGTPSEKYINVAAEPLIASQNPTDAYVTGINSSRQFVGWFASAGMQHGIFGYIDDKENVAGIEVVDYVGATPAGSKQGTQLFGISETSVIVGTANDLVPFTAFQVLSLDTLKTLGAEFIQKVYASVAAGGRGPATGWHQPPGTQGPEVPWIREMQRVLEALGRG